MVPYQSGTGVDPTNTDMDKIEYEKVYVQNKVTRPTKCNINRWNNPGLSKVLRITVPKQNRNNEEITQSTNWTRNKFENDKGLENKHLDVRHEQLSDNW